VSSHKWRQFFSSHELKSKQHDAFFEDLLDILRRISNLITKMTSYILKKTGTFLQILKKPGLIQIFKGQTLECKL
jgi:hypothetical protein